MLTQRLLLSVEQGTVARFVGLASRLATTVQARQPLFMTAVSAPPLNRQVRAALGHDHSRAPPVQPALRAAALGSLPQRSFPDAAPQVRAAPASANRYCRLRCIVCGDAWRWPAALYTALRLRPSLPVQG